MRKNLEMIGVLCMVGVLCGCSASATYTETTTTTTTDANGNKTSTTTTTTTDTSNGSSTTTTTQSAYPEGSCGAAAEDGETHTVDISIENTTGDDIKGIYMCLTGATEWSNLLGDDEYLGDGEIAEDYITVTYDSDSLVYDMGIDDADGETHEFDEIDISDVDAEGFTITFSKTDAGYTWAIDAAYVK